MNSDKRHLILTGDRGAGKTTLVNKLFPSGLPKGITTYAISQKGVYMRQNGSVDEVVIGVYDSSLEQKNKMRPCTNVFETFGTDLLNKLSKCDDEWICIDEIGFLETECDKYCRAVEFLMEQKRVVAVVRKQAIPFLQSLCKRKDVFLVDLDDPFGNNACVIMASGEGRRFGSNKLMANFNGEPMILRAIAATDNLFKKRVVVTRHKQIADICDLHGIECVLHDLPYKSDTIRLGIQAVAKSDSCTFCPGDQPLLRQDSLTSLALASKNSPDNIWRLSFEGEAGAPVVFPKWTFEKLLSLPQDKGGNFVTQQYPQRLRSISAKEKFELMDVDTPDDIVFLQNQLQ